MATPRETGSPEDTWGASETKKQEWAAKAEPRTDKDEAKEKGAKEKDAKSEAKDEAKAKEAGNA